MPDRKFLCSVERISYESLLRVTSDEQPTMIVELLATQLFELLPDLIRLKYDGSVVATFSHGLSGDPAFTTRRTIGVRRVITVYTHNAETGLRKLIQRCASYCTQANY